MIHLALTLLGALLLLWLTIACLWHATVAAMHLFVWLAAAVIWLHDRATALRDRLLSRWR